MSVFQNTENWLTEYFIPNALQIDGNTFIGNLQGIKKTLSHSAILFDNNWCKLRYVSPGDTTFSSLGVC